MTENSGSDARETLSPSPANVRRIWVEPAINEIDLNLAEQATVPLV